MKTSELDYFLPTERIAQKSVEPRDHSKLLVVDRTSGETRHEQFFDIVKYLRPDDVLVFNNTKVFRARLRVGTVEILLLRPSSEAWLCLGKPGKKLQPGMRVELPGTVIGEVTVRHEDGEFEMKFSRGGEKMSAAEVIDFANEHGEIPLPPYVKNGPTTLGEYQTVYARHTGSVAAPTAGFHFTEDLRAKIQASGVTFLEVTLHVGIGTFQPVKTEEVEAHPMHSEWVSVDRETAGAIAEAKKVGRRVIAVGTTTTRALEGAAEKILAGESFEGDINIFINPGYTFKIIDGLVTNFHLPKSTLLLLVSAFLGEGWLEHLKKIYADAINREYRFFSFGDGMFIK